MIIKGSVITGAATSHDPHIRRIDHIPGASLSHDHIPGASLSHDPHTTYLSPMNLATVRTNGGGTGSQGGQTLAMEWLKQKEQHHITSATRILL